MLNEFKIKLNADNYLVADHRIDGTRVLPGIAYLDIIARCFQSECFELTQVSYPHAAKVEPGETLILCIVYNSQYHSLEIYHQEQSQNIVHFKSVVEFKKPNLPVLMHLSKENEQIHSMSTIYSLARASFIEHGEFMQVSGTTGINDSKITMNLTLGSKAQAYLSSFYLHPALLDGATFAIAALHFDEVAHAGPDIGYLPLGIDKVSVFGRVTTSTLIVKAEIMPTQHESLIKSRIHIFTPTGDLVVALEGLTNKRFQRRQFRQQDVIQSVNPLPTVHGDTHKKIAALIRNHIQDAPDFLEPQVSFFDLGFDSSSLIALVDVLEQQFNLELYPTLLFEQNTMEKLTAYINSRGSSSITKNLTQKISTLRSSTSMNIATSMDPTINPPKAGCVEQAEHLSAPFEYADYALYIPTKTKIKERLDNKQVLIINDRLTYDQALKLYQKHPKEDWVIYDGRYHQTDLDLHTVLSRLVETFAKLLSGGQGTLPPIVLGLSPKQVLLIPSVSAFFSCLAKEYPQQLFSILVSDECVNETTRYFLSRQRCIYLHQDALYAVSYLQPQLNYAISHSSFKTGGSYLIVGGHGGLGRLLASYLRRQYHAKIHVIGRSQKIESDENSTYYSLDVADADAVNDFFATHDFPIDGLFYLAGDKHDRLLMNISNNDITKTLRSKLDGLRVIHHALQYKQLDFYCIYSSLSAEIGNLGQSIYAAANAAVNGYACEQEQLRLAGKQYSRFISISWPYWLDGGMEINPHQLQKLQEEYGTLPLGAPHAFALLEHAFATNVPHVVIANPKLLQHRLLKSQTRQLKFPTQLEAPEVNEHDIAIIGMSFQLPDAANLEELWNNLAAGKNSIKMVQRNWHYTPYPWGGYLDDISSFDPLFFNISPRDAALIDPQERLFLANAWHCLEDAGYAQIQEKNMGVVAASMFHLYQNYGVEQYQECSEVKCPQSSGASIANRVSYALNLTGPSFSLDSMCSSSLTAIELACRYLTTDEVDAMLVGGVNLCSHPYKLASLVQNKFLSPTGKSAPFHEQADGYVPGEGVVVLLLKKANKALADGDSIYALIKGLALNHGGMGSGFTVPNAAAQAKVMQHALAKARIKPEQIDYIEAHGTGTSLGDPIELAALKQVFGTRSVQKPLYVGSIKSNFGHLEAAAGMAGIVKLIAQFQAQALAPSINALPLNPGLNINAAPIQICTHYLPQQTLHFAGLSSFGAGGSNAHLILQNYSQNLIARPKTQYNKQNYWLPDAEIVTHHCYRMDRIMCNVEPVSIFEELCQLDNGVQQMYFKRATIETRGKKVVIVFGEARFTSEQLIAWISQCIVVNPEVQFIFIHQSRTQWMESHALMMSLPNQVKYYHKNILIPHLFSLSPSEVANIVSNEAQQLDHRLVVYDTTRQAISLSLVTTPLHPIRLQSELRVVVLGGLGAIGYQFCHTLIAAGIYRFDVIGRSALDVKRHQMLADLGGEIQYIQHDFSSPYHRSFTYDFIINCLGVMPGKNKNEVAQRKKIQPHLSRFIQLNHPHKLISISSLSALAGFSNQEDYAIYNAALIAHSDYCQEHVCVYLPFVMTETSASSAELNWLRWSKNTQGLEPLTTDNIQSICRQLLTLEAGEYIPFKGDPQQFHKYLTQECLTVQVKKLQERISLNQGNSLYELIESILGISAQQIKAENTFYQLGFNSLTLSEFAEAIAKQYHIHIDPNQFFEFHTLQKLHEYLQNNTKNFPLPLSKKLNSTSVGVVICGYHCSFPQCPTPEEYWHALLTGKDCTQMPLKIRFKDEHDESRKIGFIDHYADFDFHFFELGLEQAKYMDPQQRKLLELSWHVFEQGGVSPATLKGKNIGVFVAIQFDDYARLLDRSQINSLYQITGCAKTFAANRISHFFDFHGPSETIDTACSSSFTALNRAVAAIKNGECESALVLGVSLLCDIKTLELTTQLNVLSPTNYCRPFDAQADGYVKGEGVAGLWLVGDTLAAAQKLRIEATIKAIQVNHGGQSQSLTAPNPLAQKQLLSQVYQGGISIDEIDYFEAHATATRLGDPIEFSVLQELFAPRIKPLYIGSVKSNIGHTEPVAGLAGVIKGLLMLKHQIIPPQANFQEVNPLIRLAESPFRIAKKAEVTQLTTIAINSFGFGGSNGHCILTRDETSSEQLPKLPYVPIKLSAKSNEALVRISEQLLDYVCTVPDSVCLTQLSYTLNVGRADFECRKLLIVEDLDDLCEQLKREGKSSNSVHENYSQEQTLLGLQHIPHQLKGYLERLALVYQEGRSIDWQHVYEGINAIPLVLPVYPFATHYCWFDAPETSKAINKEIEAYEPIWRKKNVRSLELHRYQHRALFLTRMQEQQVKEALQQIPYKGMSCFIFVEEQDSVEQGMRWLHEHPCELIYYFAGMCQEPINTISLLDSQRLGMAGFLDLIKRLEELAYREKSLTLYIFSNNAYGLKESVINPYAASMHGLAQSLKKEHPFWLIECIDLADNRISAQALVLSNQGQAFPLVLAHDGVWHRQLKAVNHTLNPCQRTDEVIVLIGGDGHVGRLLVPKFIERNPRALIIVGRSIKTRTEGVLHWKTMDCTVAVEVDSLLDEVIQRYGTIDWLYHLGACYSESPVTSLNYEDYLSQMSVKVLGTYHLIKACHRREVKHVIITSSVQIYTQNKNRGAYSATCYYADALIKALRSEKTKLVHWGFWQQDDEVANQLMLSSGISPITPEQGYHSLQLTASLPQSDLSFFNVSESVKTMMPICTDSLTQETEDLLLFNRGLFELEYFCFHLMKHHLQTQGLVWSQNYSRSEVQKDYEPYYLALINMLKDFERNHVSQNPHQIKSHVELLHDQLQLIRKYPQIKPFVQLLKVCGLHFTEVVTGQKTIQQIMFPFGRDDLVRGIYQKNLLAHYYNQTIASLVKDISDARHTQVDILELGGGTGATTEAILTQCAHKVHFTFSDINPQFVARAKEYFSKYAEVETCILDINKPMMNKQFDLIIASNVLHTTDNIRQCLLNIIPLLRKDGVLIINEATANSLFLACTFGLFKQWHTNKDEYRIPASALLHAETWEKLLQEIGFSVEMLAMPKEVDQSIFVARLKIGPRPHTLVQKAMVSQKERELMPAKTANSDELLTLFARHVHCATTTLDLNQSLVHYGLDSLAAIHLAEQIKGELKLNISPTVLLEPVSILQLINSIAKKKEELLC
ncbi:SDR family NAD(P)-dependent oxidoreductase [Legionella sp. PC997]|uniref:SDR family NAD(P)-dependent oxidoreductase n=1 Tax=Legionella sp. PC997 TaxID=2755562 RepID=UPI0015FAEAA0|nr:SDR family NAD(P)-dependent oxidoreductase [Legionella sp. PC997]QMT59120.1 Acyl carrier protein [Legionella sp. PC997]